MEKNNRVKVTVFLLVLILTLAMSVQTANAALTLEKVKTWYWTSNTGVNSVVQGDVDGGGTNEIVTGGYFNDGARDNAQLCVWNGQTLALKFVKTWYWTGDTRINSIALGDVDGDKEVEIVTGGSHIEGYYRHAQLCVWNGATLTLKKVQTWRWGGSTWIACVATGDVDGDGLVEVFTGGSFFDTGVNGYVAQLCVWSGKGLTFKQVQTWRSAFSTYIYSLAYGFWVDAYGNYLPAILTGGEFVDSSVRRNAQLCVWSAIEPLKTLSHSTE